MMDAGECWRKLFNDWPQNLPRQGLLITTFNEAIPFVNFLVSEGILLVERDRPDSANARKVMVTFNAISALKSTSPGDLTEFKVLGFE